MAKPLPHSPSERRLFLCVALDSTRPTVGTSWSACASKMKETLTKSLEAEMHWKPQQKNPSCYKLSGKQYCSCKKITSGPLSEAGNCRKMADFSGTWRTNIKIEKTTFRTQNDPRSRTVENPRDFTEQERKSFKSWPHFPGEQDLSASLLPQPQPPSSHFLLANGACLVLYLPTSTFHIS